MMYDRFRRFHKILCMKKCRTEYIVTGGDCDEPEVKTKVIKRNGKEVSFDISKITHAIEKANEEVDNLHQINIFQISAIADKIAKKE